MNSLWTHPRAHKDSTKMDKNNRDQIYVDTFPPQGLISFVY